VVGRIAAVWMLRAVGRLGKGWQQGLRAAAVEKLSGNVLQIRTGEYEQRMDKYTADEYQQALRPIASLISKSEKAQQKLADGTWQHRMLRDNVKALTQASALINRQLKPESPLAIDDLQESLPALKKMITKTEDAMAKCPSGTAQDTLLRNRLKALRIAAYVLNESLETT